MPPNSIKLPPWLSPTAPKRFSTTEKAKRASLPRIRLDPTIPEGWSEGIRDWLDGRARDRSRSARARQIYSDILCNARMPAVARTLLSLEQQLLPPEPPLHKSTVERLLALPEAERLKAFAKVLEVRASEAPSEPLVIPFLEMAALLAERAEHLDKLPTRAESLKSLARAAEALLKLLPLERSVAWLYLSETNSKDRHSTRNALARFNELVASLTDIQVGASSSRDISDLHDFLHPRRTRNTSDSVERYFLRGLVTYATYLFKRPLHGVAGIFATVCLRLPEIVTAKEAKELSRPIR